jgi:hypothetical protein
VLPVLAELINVTRQHGNVQRASPASCESGASCDHALGPGDIHENAFKSDPKNAVLLVVLERYESQEVQGCKW